MTTDVERDSQEVRNRARRRITAIATWALPADRWMRARWHPGVGIFVPEVDAL